MSSEPEFLYKYKSISSGEELARVISIVRGKGIYAALPSQLNDPMEGKGMITGPGHAGISFIKNAGKTPSCFLRDVNECRVLSLSSSPRSPQMWAHYADGYRGVCIQFKTSCIPFETRAVSYVVRPEEQIWCDETGTRESYEAARKALLTKHIDWQYEYEHRAIFDPFEVSHMQGCMAPIGIPSALIIGQECSDDCASNLLEVAKQLGIPTYRSYIADIRYEIRILPYGYPKGLDGRSIEDMIKECCIEANVPDSSEW